MAIAWTKYWGGGDDGTTLKGIDIRNIQDDLANVTDVSAIGVTVQAYDEDLDNLSSPENVSTLNLVTNGAFDTFTSSPTPDNWVVEGGGTEAQETADVRVGENAYSLTSDADGSASRQTIFTTIDGSENSYWRGRDVTLAALVYATAASNARIQVDDGITTSESIYHTGTAGWELLTVTHTLSATASKLDVVLVVDGNVQEGIFDAVRLNHGKSTWQFSRSPTEDVQSSTFDAIHLTERASGPTTAANTGALYTKDVNGSTELFFRYESTGTEVQLTSGGTASRKETFLANGTFTAPSGVTQVYLTMVGGGGAGSDTGPAVGTSGGGGGGGTILNRPYTVVPGNNYAVVIGAEGIATTFDGTVSAPAGKDGSTVVAGAGATPNSTTAGDRESCIAGGDGAFGASGGAGGSTLFGLGGEAQIVFGDGNNAGANTGAGGGGADSGGGGSRTGGSGGSGICIVAY